MYNKKLLKNISQFVLVVFVFLIMADIIVNVLLNIFPVKPSTYQSFIIFDLVISLFLTAIIIHKEYILKEKIFKYKYSILLIVFLLPINFLYAIFFHSLHISFIKPIIIICVIAHIVSLILSFREFKDIFVTFSKDNNLNYSIIILASVYIICTILFFIIEDSVNPGIGTIEDAIWYSIASITSTGYGDITPITHAGRLLGSFLMIAGFVFTTFATASVASILTSRLNENREHINKNIYSRVNNLTDKFREIVDKNNEEFSNLEKGHKVTQDQINILLENQKKTQDEINELKELIKNLNKE